MKAARAFEFVLEQSWGPVGESLRTAKTLPDIRNAFGQVQHIECSGLDLFKHPETLRANGNDLRRLRKELKQTQEQVHKAAIAQRYAKDWHERAQRDLASETNETRKQELELACSEWLRKSQQADAETKELQSRRHSLTARLRQSEAFFAQSEILDFIRSGRREFTPFNVAAAMAGLPYLTARMSSQQAWAMKPQFTKGHVYLLFASIRANFSEWPRDMECAILKMRDYLTATNRSKLPHIKELRKNWFFLETAIRITTERPSGSRGSLPYRIFAEYMNRFSCQRAGESVLAETQRILIADESPELEDLPHWSK